MRFSNITIFLISTILLAACIHTSSEPPIVSTRVIDAPPPSDDPPIVFDLTVGAGIFTESCAPCHGEQGLGDGPAASGFSCPMPQLALYPPETNLIEWFEIVQNGKRSSDTCIMPPWNQRLNTEQMWQAVAYTASLRHDSNLLGIGESLLSNSQTDTDASYLNTVVWQVSQTDTDILNAVSQNTLEGFNFGESLSAEDQQAVLAAVRARVYLSPPVAQAPVETEEVEVAQNVTPVQTEEAEDIQDAQATQDVTPEPVQTEELTEDTASPSTTTDTFILSGKLVAGTAEASIPSDLSVTLRVVSINDAGEPEEIYNQTATTNADQIFNFTDVPRNPRALAVLETDYADLRQRSTEIFVGEITDDLYLFDFTVYETTTDSSGLSILYLESLVDAVTAESASLIFQNYEVINNSDRVILPNEAGYTLQIPLPQNATDATIEAFRSTTGRFQLVEENDTPVFYDTFPVYPNSPERLTIRYGMPYNGSMTVEQFFSYPVQQLGVYVSETRGLELESDQLSPIDSGELNGISYAGWGGTSLPANSSLIYRVFDGEQAVAQANNQNSDDGSGSFVEDNTTLILGLGVLLIVLGGMFMVYDLQKTRLKTQIATTTVTISQEEILDQIAALDAEYETGRLDENRYQQERQALKAQLAKQVKK